MLNESIYVEILGETFPQVVLQVINNYFINPDVASWGEIHLSFRRPENIPKRLPTFFWGGGVAGGDGCLLGCVYVHTYIPEKLQ